MFDVHSGEVYIESDCLTFDLYWRDDYCEARITNIFVIYVEESKSVFISQMDLSSSLAETRPIIKKIDDVKLDQPRLFAAIETKLKFLDHPIAKRALNLSNSDFKL